MFTSDRLIAKLKARIRLPDNTFEDQDLLDFAHTALSQELYPELIRTREEYYVKAVTLTSTGSLRIPPRAYAGVVREIKLIKSNGDYLDLGRVSEEDIQGPAVGEPTVFYLRGNKVELYPTPPAPVDVLVSYWLAPPAIVPVAECARITGISGSVLTCDLPSSWTTSDSFDLVKGTSDYEPIELDLSASGLSAGQITLAALPTTELEVGDYVCLAGQSPYAYLQSAYYPPLIQFTISLIHEGLGDLDQKTASDNKAEAILARLRGVVTSRVQGAPIKITSPY